MREFFVSFFGSVKCQGQGALQEVEHCGTEQCIFLRARCISFCSGGEGPAVDCEMETWGQWSACSASCDGGEMRCESLETHGFSWFFIEFL